MIPALILLPATVLEDGAQPSLADCVGAVATGRTVVVGAQRCADGAVLDEFVVAAAAAATCPAASIGVAARVGAGRAASIIAREASASSLLGACDALVLTGDPGACADAARIVAALFEPGTHTVAHGAERVEGARNLPGPEVNPPIVWRDGDELWHLDADGARVVGAVTDLLATSPVPVAVPGSLLVVQHPVVTPDELAAALQR